MYFEEDWEDIFVILEIDKGTRYQLIDRRRKMCFSATSWEGVLNSLYLYVYQYGTVNAFYKRVGEMSPESQIVPHATKAQREFDILAYGDTYKDVIVGTIRKAKYDSRFKGLPTPVKKPMVSLRPSNVAH